jgi:hypothetical protein
MDQLYSSIGGLDSQLVLAHYSGTLPLVRKAPLRNLAAGSPNDDMHDQRTDVRSDVVRMLARYVRLQKDSSMRSVSGKIAMDEKRVQRSRKLNLAAEMEGLSYVEALEVFGRAYLRHRIYAPPELPAHLVDEFGRPRPRTMTRRDAVQVVHGRPSRTAGGDSNARDFTSNAGLQLKKLPAESAIAVVRVEEIKIERIEPSNKLQRARSDYGRLSGGGKNARKLREEFGTEVARLKAEVQGFDDELRSLTRTKKYRDGLELLAIYCTETPEIEAECFGFLRH